MVRFTHAGDRYVVPLDHVRRVVPLAGASRLPVSAEPMAAVTSVAGQILPVVPLFALTGAAARPLQLAWGVAVEAGGHVLCLPADEVVGVTDLASSDVTTGGGTDTSGPTRGMTRYGDVLVDLDAVMATVAQQATAGTAGQRPDRNHGESTA
jgi:chemotaxis signal transduction protein